jgi:hypothetical protein
MYADSHGGQCHGLGWKLIKQIEAMTEDQPGSSSHSINTRTITYVLSISGYQVTIQCPQLTG